MSGGGKKENKGKEREREKEKRQGETWTMAMRRRTPRRPTAMEAAAMTAGPVRNLTAMVKAAMEFPHAMILGCKAMNRPVINQCHHHPDTLKDLSSSPPLPLNIFMERCRHVIMRTLFVALLCLLFLKI